MKLTIAIIGSGNSGTELATRLANSPYRLLLFDQELAKAQVLADQLLQTVPVAEIEALNCQVDASWEADIIVLAVPESSKKDVANRIRDVATCKIVISLSVAANEIHNGDLEIRQTLQQWLPNSKVVSVLSPLGVTQPITDAKSTDAFLIGTHQEALDTVSTLVQDAGLTPVIIEDWSVAAH